ncbi:hypothetical protein HDR66_01735 [bacterium]|nr:hypothetical protein [bacterium]
MGPKLGSELICSSVAFVIPAQAGTMGPKLGSELICSSVAFVIPAQAGTMGPHAEYNNIFSRLCK